MNPDPEESRDCLKGGIFTSSNNKNDKFKQQKKNDKKQLNASSTLDPNSSKNSTTSAESVSYIPTYHSPTLDSVPEAIENKTQPSQEMTDINLVQTSSPAASVKPVNLDHEEANDRKKNGIFTRCSIL